MNSVKEIQRINERELELGIHGSGSWHDQYKGAFYSLTRDSAYIFVGGLPYDLTEGDVITIFSQYGEVVNIHLPKPRAEPLARDGRPPREPPRAPSGHNRGFGFLMYEDQRSTVLAVDNLNGTKVLGRTLRVDHVANFQQERIRDADGNLVEAKEQMLNCAPPEIVLDEEPGEDADLEDPMAAYLADKARKKRRVGRDHKDSERRSERERRDRSRAHPDREREGRDREHRERHHSDRHGDRHRHPSDRHRDRHRHHSDRHRDRHYSHHDTHDRPRRDAEREPTPSDRARSVTPTMDRHAPIGTP